MNSTDKPKSDNPRDRPRDETTEPEVIDHRTAPEQRPADPELADIEDLREAQKRQDG